MTDASGKEGVKRIFQELLTNPDARRLVIAEYGIDPDIKRLRIWQSTRLRNTYRDLLDDPETAPACEFFLKEIYAAKDFSQRDHDMERIYKLMSGLLPKRMLVLLKKVITLNNLTNALDTQLSLAIRNELAINSEITPEVYAQGYRFCGNQSERSWQIDLIQEVGLGVQKLVGRRLTAWTLRAAVIPAHAAGWGELHEFLAHGFRAFKQMKDPDHFLSTIVKRERKILDRIFDGTPMPFQV